jgi:hypothetical protein
MARRGIANGPGTFSLSEAGAFIRASCIFASTSFAAARFSASRVFAASSSRSASRRTEVQYRVFAFMARDVDGDAVELRQ